MNAKQRDALMHTLEARFQEHMERHQDLAWAKVKARLAAHSDKLRSLYEMERSGGEPDVVNSAKKSGALLFVDCSAESPSGRRSLCFDREALDARKTAKPANSVMDVAAAMGVELLNETQYRELQQLGEFDLKTSSWIATPPEIRDLGGALFGDRRYDHVFVYHNGASSYYAARGFRGALWV